MPPHHNLACIYNKNTIEVDNTVMHYGCLIGLEDGNPFRNIIHLIFVLTFTIFIPILICSLLVICFTCKKFEMSNDTGNQYERLDRIGLPANYKWYKIYSAFRYSFYIRVMIQILMTVVLISHPLCKLIFNILEFSCYIDDYLFYSLWWERYYTWRICIYFHVTTDIHCNCCHCLGVFYEVW